VEGLNWQILRSPPGIHSSYSNTGCMALKGASRRHEGQEPRADEWPMRDDLLPVVARWSLGATLIP
jgi:hypothetical protein